MKNTYLKFLRFFCLSAGFVLTFPALAQEVGEVKYYLRYSQTEGSGNATLVVESLKEINALKGTITLPEGARINQVSYGKSPISLWLKQPTVENSAISFEGIVPGGVRGALEILSFNYSSKQDKGENIQVAAEFYLHDGLGSKAISQAVPNKSEATKETPPRDAQPPEPFLPLIVSEKDLFDGKFTVIFSAQDKESGVRHYEVMEAPGPWQEAVSPHLLANQHCPRDIFVRATDNAGNFIIAQATSSKNLPCRPDLVQGFSDNKISTLEGGIIFVLVLLLISWLVWRKKKLRSFSS